MDAGGDLEEMLVNYTTKYRKYFLLPASLRQ